MTEQPDQPGPEEWDHGSEDLEPDQGEAMAVEVESPRTGLLHVDEVMRAVGTLEERPLEEHIGVFEAAQAQLRRALDIPTDPA